MVKDKFSRRAARPITPTGVMREFVGGGAFATVMVSALLFVFLHQRVISSELEHGTGGLWCSLGMPAVLCLGISIVLTFFSAKTRLLPALVPIIGLGGIEGSIIMFFVIQLRRLGKDGNVLGTIQELTMLLFLAAMFVCVLMLMLTGIGMSVPSVVGVPVALAAVLAVALFIIRAMYAFSSLVTALNRNLLLPDGSMEQEISWILRSVAPGGEEAVTVYYDRLLDSIGIALLLLSCVTMATSFRGFFAEQASMIKNSRDIPQPAQRKGYYVGYDEYTDDTARQSEETTFQLTHDGYYVEKKETSRAKFKRRERSEEPDEFEKRNSRNEEPGEEAPKEAS